MWSTLGILASLAALHGAVLLFIGLATIAICDVLGLAFKALFY